jgi:hypothetical protein
LYRFFYDPKSLKYMTREWWVTKVMSDEETFDH